MTHHQGLTSPLLLGFDHFERSLSRAAKLAHDGYPPYNIERLAPEEDVQERLRITLAVAGFRREDLDITLEDNQLTIRGKQSDADDTREFLHRGIAARQFTRHFVLADGIEIEKAHLADGLLAIDLHRNEPERLVRSIPISA